MSKDFEIGDRVVCIEGKYHSSMNDGLLDLTGVEGIVTGVDGFIRWKPFDESKRQFSPSVKGWGTHPRHLRLISREYEYEVQWA